MLFAVLCWEYHVAIHLEHGNDFINITSFFFLNDSVLSEKDPLLSSVALLNLCHYGHKWKQIIMLNTTK